ncbi:MAG TPA: PLP-dependent aspartate aminotransferase family protein, partial [Blastocatellia bacterium]|nr:PLP-dependent aspartate aminotransferase family protein [Blastocatellia bacterium]
MGFATTAIHTGSEPDESTGAVTVPIYQTSTYAQDALGKNKGYEYARTQNPTRSAVERNIAALEGARFGFAFASGMAAIDATMRLVKAGEHVVVSDNTYGGTARLFNRILANYNIEFDYVDTSDPLNVEAAIKPNTKMVFLETPTNPIMTVTDLKEVSEIAHRSGARVVCDNTFMSPYLQRPLEFGVDIVVHSTTKYLNGHSDVVGGAVIAAEIRDVEDLAAWANITGTSGAPFDAYLTLRGLRTLFPRIERQQANAMAVAEFLAGQPLVGEVHYPGLRTHPGHGLAAAQQVGFGAMLSFELKGGAEAVRRFVEGVRVFTLAESLGGVESLVAHPATMTHAR